MKKETKIDRWFGGYMAVDSDQALKANWDEIQQILKIKPPAQSQEDKNASASSKETKSNK